MVLWRVDQFHLKNHKISQSGKQKSLILSSVIHENSIINREKKCQKNNFYDQKLNNLIRRQKCRVINLKRNLDS